MEPVFITMSTRGRNWTLY